MKFSDQVVSSLKSLHPDVRRSIRQALDDVEDGKRRDTKRLTDELSQFWRLRVGKYRVIYRPDPDNGELIAEFLDTRSEVYKKFQPPS